jgi:phosphoribosyl 1,2-cyclic phosphodiesterase
MRIKVLGSAAGGGFPLWNCNCPNYDGLRRGTVKAQARTQSSIAVSANELDGLLINASPDVLAQIRATGEVTAELRALMASCQVVLVDGTFWTEDAMQVLGLSKKTATQMGHLPQSGPSGRVAQLDQLPTGMRKILIHNTNPILREDSAERATLRSHGIEVAHDGMDLVF